MRVEAVFQMEPIPTLRSLKDTFQEKILIDINKEYRQCKRKTPTPRKTVL